MKGGQRVIVGVTGSVGNLHALRWATTEARRRGTGLVAVHAWVPPGGDFAERRCPLPELRQIWRDAAWQQLWDAFDAAFGGLPQDVRIELVVVRGDPGPVLVAVAGQEDDLLVIGTGRRGMLGLAPTRRVSRYCVAHSACPVLIVPPTRLAREMEHPLHAWLVRHRTLIPRKDELSGHHS